MESAELEASVERLVAALHVLTSDVELAAGLSPGADTQFARRTHVRAVFAQIEGNLNLMANVIIEAHSRGEILLSDGELEVLREERRDTDSLGNAIVRPKFVPVRDRLSPVLKILARLYGSTFAPDKSTVGWESFLKAMDLRNRITHPKNAESFDITGSDLNDVQAARDWFANTIEKLLDEC